MSMSTAEIQRALAAAGYDLGPAGVDAVWGRMTVAALRKFQADRGLRPSGVADAGTLAALRSPLTPAVTSAGGALPAAPPAASAGTLAAQAEPPWYAEARRFLGLTEVRGRGTNPTILGWLKKLRLPWTDDETAWCGVAVGYWVAATLPDEPLPSNPAGARQWLKLGRPLQTPALGAVLVFWRGSPVGPFGHVGLYAGEERDGERRLRVLGGNQSDRVCYTWMPRDRLLGCRWPSTYPMPTGGRVMLAASGERSSQSEA